jgi:peptidyl-prolyl cis-trans isomerase A (cyclophilin A)
VKRQGRPVFHVCLGVAALLGSFAFRAGEAHAAGGNPVVVLDTSMGPISIELDQTRAPVSVDNFLKYVDSGFFNGLVFHRVMPGFMIQGGGLDENLRDKNEGLRPPIKNEASNGLTNQRGTIAMARTSDPNSATSQFFINLVDNTNKLGPGDVDPFGYAVFGRVIAGMDVVDKIAQVPTAKRGPHGDVPLKPVYIKSAKRKGNP